MMWRAVFPKKAPLGNDLDWEYLARSFELSGSSIKNIAINAAFMAAAKGKSIDMSEILAALRNEMTKSGKTIHREEFGEYYVLLK
jgi:ATP-dependent 26S proteasome regulatory subunit